MRISIVISTYNGEKFILDQLESIRNQTHQADEVIICDDCSTDSTPDLVKDYIGKNNLDWTIIINDENKGWQKNFMDLMEMASGDIVFTCDQDDIWDKRKAAAMLDIMSTHDQINLLVSDYLEFTSDDDLTDSDKKTDKPGEIRSINLNKKFFTVDYPGCTYCIRKTFFDEIKKYWKPGFPHDALLWRFSIFSDSLYVCDDVLFYWRKHAESEFAIETNRKKNLADRIEWIDYAFDFSEQILQYIKVNKKLKNRKKKAMLINDFMKYLYLRRMLFVKKNPIYAIMLLKHMGYYRDFKMYLGDCYMTYFRK